MEGQGVYDLVVEVLNDLVNGEKLHSNGEKEGLKKAIIEVLNGVTVEGMKYSYDQTDQLTLRENLVTLETLKYTYDSRGNMTGDGKVQYEYDALDRLVKVTDEKGRTTGYTYDSQGRRTAVEFNGEVTEYSYLGGSDKVIEEKRPDGTELAFTYDNQGSPLTVNYQGQTYYYILNGHGDVVALTDAQGGKAASYRYDPWGQVLKGSFEENGEETDAESKEIQDLNPYRYAGYRYDDKTKLYFLKTRYYNPLLGRFMTKDKYRGEEIGVKPIDQNKYLYANANPVNLIDPNGQSAAPSKPKPSAPKPSAPKPSAPKPSAPKPSAPKPSAPKPSAPKPSAPKPPAPKAPAPKSQPPKSQPPKSQPPKSQSPKPQKPKPQPPKPQPPKPQPPKPKPAKPQPPKPQPPKPKTAGQGTGKDNNKTFGDYLKSGVKTTLGDKISEKVAGNLKSTKSITKVGAFGPGFVLKGEAVSTLTVATKLTAKKVGIASIVFAAFDVKKDIDTYDGKDAFIASTLDFAKVGIGVAVIAATPVGWGMIGAAAVGIGVGMVAEWGVDSAKKSFLARSKPRRY